MLKNQADSEETVLNNQGDCIEPTPKEKKTVSRKRNSKAKAQPMEEPDEIIEGYVRKNKKKPRGRVAALEDKTGLMVEKGDNTKYLKLSMELMNLPDIDLSDVNQVQNRLNQFFLIHAEHDIKPTVSGMGLALNGLDRRRLYEIKAGLKCHISVDIPPEVRVSIKRAYYLMENLWENYMQNGKINPASGIFLGKNHFGYEDKVEHIITPNTQHEDYSADDIKQRYLPSNDLPQLSENNE